MGIDICGVLFGLPGYTALQDHQYSGLQVSSYQQVPT